LCGAVYSGSGSFKAKDYYTEFANAGYTVSLYKTSMQGNGTKALWIFCTSNLPIWLDRNVYTGNLNRTTNDPSGNKKPS
jgi:hypothetical protein